MNIDAASREWNDAELASLDQWRQGHLLNVPTAAWVDSLADDEAAGLRVVARADPGAEGGIPYVVIVSQTCDVVGAGPGARHPFVQVSPLRDVSGWDPGNLKQLDRHALNDYVPVTAPPVAGARWAVDLRMSWPVSKTTLLARTPTVGFADFDDERQIGTHLARKLERPALPDLLTSDVAKAMRRCLMKGLKKPFLLLDVIQIRIDVISGTLAEPGDVRVIVISNIPLNPDQMEPVRNEWNGFQKAVEDAGMTWVETAFRTWGNLTVQEYRSSVQLNIPELHSGRSNRD